MALASTLSRRCQQVLPDCEERRIRLALDSVCRRVSELNAMSCMRKDIATSYLSLDSLADWLIIFTVTSEYVRYTGVEKVSSVVVSLFYERRGGGCRLRYW